MRRRHDGTTRPLQTIVTLHNHNLSHIWLRLLVVTGYLGRLLVIFGLVLAVPAIVGLLDQEYRAGEVFLLAGSLTALGGLGTVAVVAAGAARNAGGHSAVHRSLGRVFTPGGGSRLPVLRPELPRFHLRVRQWLDDERPDRHPAA